MPALEVVVGAGAPVSVDTYRAETARRALAAGARMINDITALRGDGAMAETLAELGVPLPPHAHAGHAGDDAARAEI
jgi:dihydropteroate synthase